MKTYTAWLTNNQGASLDIDPPNAHNYRSIVDFVRANYGAGWTLHIRDIAGGDDVVTLSLR